MTTVVSVPARVTTGGPPVRGASARRADTDPATWETERAVGREDTLPLSLHTHVVDNGGAGGHGRASRARYRYALGGPCWSPPFARYIGREKPAEVAAREAEDRLSCWEWWRSDYVAAKVRRQFGDRVCDALAGALSGRLTRDAAATAAGASLRWLGRQERNVAHWVRDEYGMPGHLGQDPEHAYRADCPCPGCLRERRRDLMRFEGTGAGAYEGTGLYETTDVA